MIKITTYSIRERMRRLDFLRRQIITLFETEGVADKEYLKANFSYTEGVSPKTVDQYLSELQAIGLINVGEEKIYPAGNLKVQAKKLKVEIEDVTKEAENEVKETFEAKETKE